MYDKKVLAKGTAASFGVVAIVAMLVVSSGMAFAAPISGIGGFTIQADQIQGDDFYLYPDVSDTSERDGVPTATQEFTSISIDGLQLMKEVPGVPVIGGNARIAISATDTVEADSLLLKSSKIEASSSQFNGLLIDEENAEYSDSFHLSAPSTAEQRTEGIDGATGGPKTIDLTDASNPGLVLENASIQANYLATNQISIPGLTLAVEYDSNGDGDYSDGGDISLGS